MMPNAFELINRNRERKALAIVHICEQCGITSKDCDGAAEEGRKMAAEAAGVKPPSQETWDVVVAMLRSKEKGEIDGNE